MVALAVASCGGKIDGDSTGAGSYRGSGQPGDPAGADPAGARQGAPPPTTRPPCAIREPIREGFDSGLPGPEWGAAPGALAFDGTAPISGARSLKIDVARAILYRGFLTRSVEPACAATLRLSIRMAAPLFGAGEAATIARLVAPPAFLDVVLGPDGSVALVEGGAGRSPTVDAGELPPASAGKAHPLGSVAADAPSTLTLMIDLSAGTLWGSVSPLGAPASSGRASSLEVGRGGELTNLLVGMFTTTARTGTYWLDDLALE